MKNSKLSLFFKISVTICRVNFVWKKSLTNFDFIQKQKEIIPSRDERFKDEINLSNKHKGNSPSKHRIFGKKFTQYKKWENLGKFGLFLVYTYRMYLNEKNIKMTRKIRWSWSGECSKWHMFFGPKSVIFKHFHFSFGKTHQKNVKICKIGAFVCVFKKWL
jgi:hypothetical protein